jgi:hypothetical protein
MLVPLGVILVSLGLWALLGWGVGGGKKEIGWLFHAHLGSRLFPRRGSTLAVFFWSVPPRLEDQGGLV